MNPIPFNIPSGRYFLAMMSLLSVSAIPARSAECLPPPPGIISWWSGNNNALDLIGTNNGTLVNGANYASGIVANAFNFHGTLESVLVPDSPSLRLTSQFTLETWIYRPAKATRDEVILSKIGSSQGNNGYALFLTSQNLLAAEFNSPGQAWPGTAIVYANSSAVTTGVWHHVVWTYDQAAMKLYLDGTPVATNAIGPKVIATSASNFRIGGVDEANNTFFVGSIDEPAIYNRALTDSEIADLHNAGSAGKCGAPVIVSQPKNQVGYWGRSVTLSVSAAGAMPLSYQWLKEGAPITSATNSTLTITNLQTTDAVNYSVIVTNFLDSVLSSSAAVTVNPGGVSLALYSGITIDGVAGLTYGIQYNTDPGNTNLWKGVANVTLASTNGFWVDLQPANQPQRYYRIVPGPIPIP